MVLLVTWPSKKCESCKIKCWESDVPSNEEGRGSVLRVANKESLQELVEVLGDLILISGVVSDAISIAETSSDGLIDLAEGKGDGLVRKVARKWFKEDGAFETYKEDVGNLVPGVGVDRKLKILVNLVGTVLEEEGSQSRATGAAGEPKDERGSFRVVTGLKEPVVQVSSVILAEARNSDVARLLLSLLGAL